MKNPSNWQKSKNSTTLTWMWRNKTLMLEAQIDRAIWRAIWQDLVQVYTLRPLVSLNLERRSYPREPFVRIPIQRHSLQHCL